MRKHLEGRHDRDLTFQSHMERNAEKALNRLISVIYGVLSLIESNISV
ncbi:hypothetical protein [Halobacillus mangrovi]